MEKAVIPGETVCKPGNIGLNAGAATVTLEVADTGDRPIQAGSHDHFFETNAAVRFEPGQERDVTLVALSCGRTVYGFQQKIMGVL